MTEVVLSKPLEEINASNFPSFLFPSSSTCNLQLWGNHSVYAYRPNSHPHTLTDLLINMFDLSLDQHKLAFSLVSDWQIGKVVDPLPGEAAFCVQLKKDNESGTSFWGEKIDSYVGTIYGKAGFSADVTVGYIAENKEYKGTSVRGFVRNMSYNLHQAPVQSKDGAKKPVGGIYIPKGCANFGYNDFLHMWQALRRRILPLPPLVQPSSLHPAMHTTRGRLIVQQMLLDLGEIINDRPIKYLALYERNLIVAVDSKQAKKGGHPWDL